MVQLDSDEEMGLLRGMHGSMEAELEVQRTIKRAELTAFLCLLKNEEGAVLPTSQSTNRHLLFSD